MLTNNLSNNVDACVSILESIGYSDIRYIQSKDELRFSREEGLNPSAMRFDLQTLKFRCFSTNEYGNLYSLVMQKMDLSFPNSLHYIANELGLEKKSLSKRTRKPFSGFYKGLMTENKYPEQKILTYDSDILEDYKDKYSLDFFKDGIDFETQHHFNVGYDLLSLRTTIPEYTFEGKLCGIMGRLNDSKCDKEERWIPIIPCSRSLTLYGYHQNYEAIQSKGTVVIGESEKFVQQMYSMGSYVGLATCGCDISEAQARYIKGLLIPKVILAYDESLEEDDIREQAEKLKLNNVLFKNKVGYVYDKDNDILPKGSKCSPTDLGKAKFLDLVTNHVIWI